MTLDRVIEAPGSPVSGRPRNGSSTSTRESRRDAAERGRAALTPVADLATAAARGIDDP